MQSIILNSSNYVEGSNNKFSYRFPANGGVTFNNAKIGLQSISIFNSTFNITSAIGNNKFSIGWTANWSGSTETRWFNCVIPDGYYTVSSLNYFIQSQFIKNNLYMVPSASTNSSTINLYFIECMQNPTAYALQLNTFSLPTNATYSSTVNLYGYTVPSGAGWVPAATKQNPQIILSAGLMVFFGFSSSFNGYSSSNANALITTPAPFLTLPPTSALGEDKSYLSNISPNVNTINSYILTCNLLSSKYALPSNIFYSIPLTGTIGELITISNSNIIYNAIRNGTYESIEITLLDQNYNKLKLLDTEIVLLLSIIEG